MQENKKKILSFSLYAAEVMLCNGAEIYRVEDMVMRICTSRDVQKVNVFATPTLITISCDSLDNYSLTRRIKSRCTNLDKISKVNDLARRFTSTDISVEEATSILKEIESENISYIKKFIFAGFASACFTILFGGNTKDFFVAFIAGSIAEIVFDTSIFLLDTSFLPNIIAGLTIGLIGCFFERHFNSNFQPVVIGAIMPFVPGVVLTNSVRDFISGDLLSGSSRFFEAIVIATTIAFGVASAIGIYMII